MKKKIDLTQGNILIELLKLAIPIMATSLVQMAYNMTDMIWIGRIGSASVAAVGTAGFFIWFGFALIIISKVGAEVGVAQSIGRKNIPAAVDFARNALQLNVLLAVIYGTILFFNSHFLISFFRLEDPSVVNMAGTYLRIVACGTVFTFINPVFSGIYNGMGDSRTPFYVSSIGLIINIILDPILIFGLGPFPEMGVSGAAIATVFAQFIVFLVFAWKFSGKRAPFTEWKFMIKPCMKYIRQIIQFGSPVATQSGLFTICAMYIARIIATWGPIPIAVQKVGSQIEALSWMTASGFSTALSSFVGQNFGAEKWERIRKGYITGISLVSVVGIAVTALLVFLPRPIFSIFIPEEEAIRYGVVYLKILGLSQLFMCVEITTAGAFNGMGKTIPPSIVSIIFTGMRVPAAIILSSEALLGLDGVWWSISMSSVFKGIILVSWFMLVLTHLPDYKGLVPRRRWMFSWNLRYLRDKRALSGKA